MNYLLKNALRATLDPPSAESGDIRIRNGVIAEVGRNLAQSKNEERVDLNGKLIMPGFVCAHTHLYSSLARGMPAPEDPPDNFLEILQKLWWKLDRALDDEAIYYSALVGAIDAARNGTTALFDHHSSPSSIKGSLDIIKQALDEVGLRAVLCYEVTDRGGMKQRDEGLKENERFIRATKKHPRIRGMVGAHASFTLGTESLELCGEMAKKLKSGVHIHVAEDECDSVDAEENYQRTVVDRLSPAGILTDRSILAHCIHLADFDFERLRDSQAWLVHNPRSNINNNVGRARLEQFGNRAALGTDGFVANMPQEASFVSTANGVDALKLISGGQRMVSEYFSEKFGTFQKGSLADLVVLEYDPPTPLTSQNLFAHLLSASASVESVMVDGRWVVKDRQVVGVDAQDIFEKARRVAKKLWSKL